MYVLVFIYLSPLYLRISIITCAILNLLQVQGAVHHAAVWGAVGGFTWVARRNGWFLRPSCAACARPVGFAEERGGRDEAGPCTAASSLHGSLKQCAGRRGDAQVRRRRGNGGSECEPLGAVVILFPILGVDHLPPPHAFTSQDSQGHTHTQGSVDGRNTGEKARSELPPGPGPDIPSVAGMGKQRRIWEIHRRSRRRGRRPSFSREPTM